MDCGSTSWSRLNREGPVHQSKPLLHTRKTKTRALLCGFDVESFAGIVDGEMNFVCLLGHLHFDSRRPAMFNGVVQRFL